jgi:hypothetical protein
MQPELGNRGSLCFSAVASKKTASDWQHHQSIETIEQVRFYGTRPEQQSAFRVCQQRASFWQNPEGTKFIAALTLRLE